jgi:FAD binding domain
MPTQAVPIRRSADLPPLVLPDSPHYDTARRAWNLTADLRPAAVCVATHVEHVQAALAYARAHHLRVAAQTTGHLAQALPDLHDSILLRLALHDGEVDVDPIARTARIKAGARWGEVVDAVAPHGLAAMHGSSPSVGVTGYLLAGGVSFYARAHGLAANHVAAFEVVTADGRRRRVDHAQNPDLFFALRGGGGNFAIVTAVEFGLLPYAQVTAGAMFFPATDAPGLLRAWRDWSRTAPDSITTTFRILQLPPLPDVPEPLRAIPTVCVDGVALRPGDASALERRLRHFSDPILGGFGPTSSADVVRLHGDPEDPVAAIGDGILLDTLDDRAIEAFLRVAGPGSPLLAAEIRHLGAAVAAPPSDAGARGHLEGDYLVFGVGIPGSPAPTAELDAHLDHYLAALRPWATATRYMGFAERTSSVEAFVPPRALERLRRIGQAVDPDHLLVSPVPLPDAGDQPAGATHTGPTNPLGA